MADKNSYPLSLLLKAVDGVTAPLRKINAEIEKVTAPARVAGNAIASIGKEGGFDRLRDGIGGVLTNVRNVGSEITSLTKRLAVGLGAAGFAAYEFVQPTIESSAALKFQAQRLNISVDELASYRFAAREANVSQDEFSAGLDYFNRILGQTKAGRGRLRSLLQGVTGGAQVLKELETAKGTGSALNVLVTRLNGLTDSSKRAALAAAAFGAGNVGMLNFAELGAKRIAELRAQQERLGGSQEQFSADAVKAALAEAELGEAWEGTRRTLLSPILPILSDQLRSLTGFLVDHRQEIRAWAADTAQAIGRFAQSLPARLQSFLAFTSRAKSALQPIADLVGGWPTLFLGVAAAIAGGPLLGAIAQLTASIVTLGLAIGFTPIGWLIAGIAALGIAVVAITGKYNNMFDAAQRALHPGQPDPLDGSKKYTLEEAEAERFKRNQQPGPDVLSPHGPLQADASRLPAAASRPSIVPPALSGTASAPAVSGTAPAVSGPAQAPAFGRAPADWHVDASQLGVQRDVHASLKIEVAAPKGTKVSKLSSSFDDLVLSVGGSLAEAH